MEDVLIPIVAILSTIALPIVTALVLILKNSMQTITNGWR